MTTKQKLQRIVALARQASPQVDQTKSTEDIKFFAQSAANAWSRLRHSPTPADSLRLWERVGAWSLAAAAAVVLFAAAFHSSAAAENPFDPFGPDDTEETLFF
ncbi:MAG: hypothetical protein ABI651_02800 [Verrucomicrobiota bacterium]